jgi:hypothetical protein
VQRARGDAREHSRHRRKDTGLVETPALELCGGRQSTRQRFAGAQLDEALRGRIGQGGGRRTRNAPPVLSP